MIRIPRRLHICERLSETDMRCHTLRRTRPLRYNSCTMWRESVPANGLPNMAIEEKVYPDITPLLRRGVPTRICPRFPIEQLLVDSGFRKIFVSSEGELSENGSGDETRCLGMNRMELSDEPCGFNVPSRLPGVVRASVPLPAYKIFQAVVA